jgi:hypothetical protein
MQTSKLNDRLQILASVAVLAGILLVAYEIRRNNTLAEAESIRMMLEGWDRVFISHYETDISELITKSRKEPKNLTISEIERLDGWLSAISNQYIVTFEMSDRGLGYGGVGNNFDPAEDLAAVVESYYGTAFGRAWYEENKFWFIRRMREVIDRELAAARSDSHASQAERIKSRLME